MQKIGKLELNWVGKYDEKELEPRILVEDKSKSFGDHDSGNMLIHGDNLIALKALEQNFAGKIKCIYIDPPYNIDIANPLYEDGLGHSEWLCIMRPRFEILRNLLADDGFICCHIDDAEGHYLKVLMDEVFRRENYLTSFYIKVRYAEKTLKSDMDFHKEIEQVLIYRKEFGAKPNFGNTDDGFAKFNYFIQEVGESQTFMLGGKKVEVFPKGTYKIEKQEGSEFGLKEIWASGTILDGNSSGRFFRDYLTGRYSDDGYGVLYKVYGIGDDRYDYRYFTGPQKIGATKGKYFQGVPNTKLENKDTSKKEPIRSFYDLAGSFGNCRSEGGVEFRGGKKPEALLELVLTSFSNRGDIVLDSFLGSGSTAAVAHKMSRKWIGIELGSQAYSHCKVRLDNVINGDQTGISKSVGWTGGGGYKFYELAPSLLEKHPLLPVYTVSKFYTFEMLCEAICKLEGFKYSPQGEMHGKSSETRFIHIANNYINAEYVKSLLKDLGEKDSVLIYGTKIQSTLRLPNNVIVKKIPKDLLEKCVFESEVK